MTAEDAHTGRDGLGASASRGALVTLGAQGLRLAVQLTGISVLARMLAPEDYGLVAIVLVVVTFGELFRDFGLSSAAIQAKNLTTGQRDNLFWLNAGFGCLLAAVVCACSPLLARGFGDDRLQALAVVLSATFVLNGISTQYRAMHARNLAFGKLSAAELVGQVLGVATGIAFAAGGAGYWSLAAQQLSQQLVTQVLLVAGNPWWPGAYKRAEPVRPFLGYGLSLLGSQVLNNLAVNTASVVLGLRASPSEVGLYNRAYQLVMMPLLQVQAPSTRVALPVLSRLQDDPRRFGDFLCTGQLLLLGLIGPTFAVLFAQADSIVPLALGDGWTGTIPLFRTLLVAGFFQAASYATYWVLLASGRTRAQLLYALATRPVVVLLVVLGSSWGAQGAAAAYAIGLGLAWPASLWWASRVPGAPVRRMFGNGARIGVVVTVATAVSAAATAPLAPGAHLLRTAVGGVVVLVAAALLTAAWPSIRRDALEVIRTSRRMISRRRAPTTTASGTPPTDDGRDSTSDRTMTKDHA